MSGFIAAHCEYQVLGLSVTHIGSIQAQTQSMNSDILHSVHQHLDYNVTQTCAPLTNTILNIKQLTE